MNLVARYDTVVANTIALTDVFGLEIERKNADIIQLLDNEVWRNVSGIVLYFDREQFHPDFISLDYRTCKALVQKSKYMPCREGTNVNLKRGFILLQGRLGGV